MRILTWNSNGAFRRKFESLIDLNVDIFVIQECENPELSTDNNYKKWAKNYLWVGDSKNKGLGIFAKNDIVIEKLNWNDNYESHKVKYFLPILINKEQKLLGIWAHSNNSPTFGYIGQIWKYLQLNMENIANTIIVGDFNSNSIWDKWDRWWNHSDVIRIMEEKGLESIYHKNYSEKQGEESQPTFYLQRNINKPYHIDYIFTELKISRNIKEFKIFEKEKWLKYSDHLPIIFEY